MWARPQKAGGFCLAASSNPLMVLAGSWVWEVFPLDLVSKILVHLGFRPNGVWVPFWFHCSYKPKLQNWGFSTRFDWSHYLTMVKTIPLASICREETGIPFGGMGQLHVQPYQPRNSESATEAPPLYWEWGKLYSGKVILIVFPDHPTQSDILINS